MTSRQDTAGAQPAAGARVLFVQYTNPGAYPPLLHAAELLIRGGCRVRVLAMGSEDDPRRFALAGATVRRFGRWSSRPLRPLHYALFVAWTMGQALIWRPTWVYASDPLSCPAAWAVGRLRRARLVYHEHDSPDAHATAGRSAFLGLVLRARAAVVRAADLCVTPGAGRAEAVARQTGRAEITVVWNCPLLREVGPEPVARDGLRVVYHGSIVPARVPLTLIDALARLPESVTLTVVGYQTAGHPGHVATLEARARAAGVAHRLSCRGPVSREALLREGSSFDVGVSLLPADSTDLNERSMVGPSNKPLDYMACGLAILVSDLPDWRETFVDAGFGIACRAGDPDDIAAALRWLLEHPSERTAMGRRSQDRIRARWNYEAAFAPVLDRMLRSAAAAPLVSEVGRA